MFSTQHWQVTLVFAGFGGFLMLIEMLFSSVAVHKD